MVRGQECQRVYLAAQLLSERVAKAVSHIFGDRYRKEAELIALVDEAFDTFNSRHMSDGKLHRSAFGMAHTIDEQYSCLFKFTQVLAYVAGYVAAECATVDSTLGKITSDASEVPRDERYA
ncbi:hypothetical protein FJT64_020750 [Amphibalanus amphitrite]|uniref:Uncharacterized protein n=1 Tax=Amphibalanus amphitrite TaxID=1232801 RepID=A0A6A4WM94_AMPAM|nr:hypothetical protein FJT64_020750 [Amphibalanus amphitrite]